MSTFMEHIHRVTDPGALLPPVGYSAEADLPATGADVASGNESADPLHEDLLGAEPTGNEAHDLVKK